MRRQLLATAAAITTTLALAVAVPAFADHEDPELVPGNPSCESLGLGESLDKIEFDADQPTEFEIDPADYPGFVITGVIVKGGPNALVYDEPPFDHLTAPEGKEISHIEVCGEEEVDETETPTPTPTNGETTPANGETTPANGETTPPVVVPTEVPAGVSDGGSGSAGLVGLIIAAGAAAAGFVLFARRRALHDS
jgi:hypothetical protein